MSGVSVDTGGGGGRRATDSQINMVPMIDLLISCIAFLLMTAVWIKTGALQAAQPRSVPNDQPPQDTPQDQLKIVITPTGLRVGTNAADMRDIAHNPQRFTDLEAALRQRLATNQQNREVWLQPDSAVQYQEIIRVMDTVYGVYGSAAAQQVTIRFL